MAANKEPVYRVDSSAIGKGSASADRQEHTPGRAEKRYSGLREKREPFLIRARRAAKLTVPYLFRDRGSNGTTDEELPWQSLGADLVNNLTGKLVTGLFPSAGLTFFRLDPAPKVFADYGEMAPDQRAKLKVELSRALSKVEKQGIKAMGEDGDKTALTDGLRHGVVGGNHGFKFFDKRPMQSIPLDDYVTVRDKSGQLIEFVIEDTMMWEMLSDSVRSLCTQHGYTEDASKDLQQEINVYTHGRRSGDTWTVYQEAWGAEVPGSRWTYSDDDLPYLFFCMNLLKGEHYGRSYCEDYEADLQTFDAGEQTITEGSQAAAQTVRLVKPGGVTNKKAIAEAPNGAVLTGDVNDVGTMQSEKQADFQILFQAKGEVGQRLARAFLRFEQRQGERVTAEEIAQVVKELQEALGGIYTNLVTALQTPYIKKRLRSFMRTGRIPKLPKESVTLTVLTGEEALGRMSELQALDALVTPASPAAQEQAARRVNWGGYFQQRAAALALDSDGLLYTDEELAQQDAQAQQAQVVQQIAPQATKGVADLINKQVPEAAPDQPQGEAA